MTRAREEFIEQTSTLHLQHLNGREDFQEAFELGIGEAWEEFKDKQKQVVSAEEIQNKAFELYPDVKNDDSETYKNLVRRQNWMDGARWMQQYAQAVNGVEVSEKAKRLLKLCDEIAEVINDIPDFSTKQD